MSSAAQRVLVLGGPSAGKSTFLIQLHGRLNAGDGRLTARSAPRSLQAVLDGYRRLQQGLPAAHTPSGTDTELELAANSRAGQPVDVTLPDYAGEDLRHLAEGHRVPDRWRKLAVESDHWMVMIRLALHPDLPDLLTRPVGELARASDDTTDEEVPGLPIDMWAVELLQVLLHARVLSTTGAMSPPHLTLVLSCWDELNLGAGALPGDVARERLALLDSFCRSRWLDRYRVVGLSSQGQTLVSDRPDDRFIDYGPASMGWYIDQDGAQEHDLTALIDPA